MSRLACLIALSALAVASVNVAPGAHPGAITPLAAADARAASHCEIRVYKRGGATNVEGVLYAGGPVWGSYRLTVNGGPAGAPDKDESGGFSASPTGSTSLGQIVVGPGTYSAHMTVRWKGGETTCAQHVGP